MTRKHFLTIALLVSALVVPVVAQSQPPWPDWVWPVGSGNGEIDSILVWPPGTYPAYTCCDRYGNDVRTEIIVDQWGLNFQGMCVGCNFCAAFCTDESCQEIAIQGLAYPGGGFGETPMQISFRIRWSDWVQILTPTPPTTLTPGTTTPPPNTVTPPPPTPTPQVDCPADVIEQQPPRAEMLSKTPQNPVVRGQGGMGLIITYRATSFPVVRHYWVKVDNSHWGCVHVETGFEDDGRYGVSPCAAWEGWETRWISDVRCEEKIEVIPDPIVATSFAGHARLRENSKRWIEGELQQRYPGARVKKPDWDVAGRVVRQGCYSDGRCILEAQVYFPFEDPGWYDVWADGRTAGTAYTPPRTFRYQPPEPQPVYLMDSTLIPDW